MTETRHPILRDAQAEYLEGLVPPRDALRREMESSAAEQGLPISSPQVGRLLEIVARSSRASHILEVGTAIGYGTLCLALGAPQARITTIERDPERLASAREYLTRAGVIDRVELVSGEAIERLAQLPGPFDLVYLDGDKAGYRRCLDQVLPKMPVGGTILADNVLWKGEIADPPAGEEAPEAQAILAFNDYLTMHPQLAAAVLPLGDGVGLAVKTRQLMSEMGGPY